MSILTKSTEGYCLIVIIALSLIAKVIVSKSAKSEIEKHIATLSVATTSIGVVTLFLCWLVSRLNSQEDSIAQLFEILQLFFLMIGTWFIFAFNSIIVVLKSYINKDRLED